MNTATRLAIKGSGRLAVMLIRPEQDIAAPRPDCTLCTWVGDAKSWKPDGTGLFYLKYVSASCIRHQHVRCLPG